MKYCLSTHAKDMIKERNINESWIEEVIKSPDWKIETEDKRLHLYKKIQDYDNRILHIVMESRVSPYKIITAYFDRNARRKSEIKS